MRADTKTISIAASPLKIVRLLADPRNLPRWAVGFAQAVNQQGDRWLVRAGAGDMEVRIEANESVGTVDFFMSPAPGVEVLAASRVVPRGSESEYAFTQFQAPGTEAVNDIETAWARELKSRRDRSS